MHIKWQIQYDVAFGKCNNMPYTPKYYVGVSTQADGSQLLVANLRNKKRIWMHVDYPVESIEHGIALCEAWEATGAY